MVWPAFGFWTTKATPTSSLFCPKPYSTNCSACGWASVVAVGGGDVAVGVSCGAEVAVGAGVVASGVDEGSTATVATASAPSSLVVSATSSGVVPVLLQAAVR